MESGRKVELVRLAPDVSIEDASLDDGRAAADVFPTEHKKMKTVDESVIQAALGVHPCQARLMLPGKC